MKRPNAIIGGSLFSIAATLGSVASIVTVAPSPLILWPALIAGGSAILGNILALFGHKKEKVIAQASIKLLQEKLINEKGDSSTLFT